MDKQEAPENIRVHRNPHNKYRLSTKGRIHPESIEYIRADIAESRNRELEKALKKISSITTTMKGAPGGLTRAKNIAKEALKQINS